MGFNEMRELIKKLKKDPNLPIDEFIKDMSIHDSKIIFQIPTYIFTNLPKKLDYNFITDLSRYLFAKENVIYIGTYRNICCDLDISHSTFMEKIQELKQLEIFDHWHHNKKFLLGFHKNLITKILNGDKYE